MKLNDRQLCKAQLQKLKSDGGLERHCSRCGDCCRLSIVVQGGDGKPSRVLIPELPCKFLKDNKCSVYKDRQEKAPWCQDTLSGLEAGLYTGGCGYLKGSDKWYNGSQALPADLMEYVLPQVLDCLDSFSDPLSADDVSRFKEAARRR